jgi:hypothetical protein
MGVVREVSRGAVLEERGSESDPSLFEEGGDWDWNGWLGRV